MKFCYIDESGTGEEPVMVSVGVIVDAQRMHQTKKEWSDLLAELNKIAKRPIVELHTRDLYAGNSEWRGVDGAERSRLIHEIIQWLIERKHKITFSAIDKAAFKSRQSDCHVCSELKTQWRIASFHIALTIQKAHEGFDKTKGHTVFIYDREVIEEDYILALFHKPPEWSDSYYGKDKKRERLDLVIDVPYFANSEQVSLLQIADLVAYILRRYSELLDKQSPERYTGERERITGWVNSIKSMLYPVSTRYLKKGRCKTAEAFYQLAPASLRTL